MDMLPNEVIVKSGPHEFSCEVLTFKSGEELARILMAYTRWLSSLPLHDQVEVEFGVTDGYDAVWFDDERMTV